jgi:hypothetical protein
MKTMSCKQLGGACNKLFSANTFQEMAMLSQSHGKEMFKASDESHLQIMEQMNKTSEDQTK